MKNNKENTEWIFWTTITIIFALLIHNGTEPLFLIAYSLIPILILVFYYKKSFWTIVIYILFFGIAGRFTRYFRQGYMSDTLPAINDFIGYFIHGKNVYKELVMSQTGPTPFIYLPFSLLWYLPSRLLKIDFRFFEMIISCLIPIVIFFYGCLLGIKWKILPILSVVSLTPFLLDLSADGSNDNSAIFLLLTSLLFIAFAKRKNSQKSAIISAIILGFAISFKHYTFFFLLFFIPFLLHEKRFLPIASKKYLLITFITFSVISLPFIFFSPAGFIQSLFYIEVANRHPLWGWNIWVALKELFAFTPTIQQMWIVRTSLVLATIVIIFRFFKLDKFNKVFVAASLTVFVYLIFSQWTTYAYFTFLIPLLCLSAFNTEK